MSELLPVDVIPRGFQYPASFLRVVELELIALEPWWILEGNRLRLRFGGLRERYPDRSVVPFANRQDNDDVACFDLDRGGISVIHDFASVGWEQREVYPTFYAWFRKAVEDLIEFGPEDER